MSRKARGPSHSEIQAKIGQRMMWARELVEPNRAAFARLCGTDTSTLTKIEKGERAPSVFIIREYTRRLRVSADYLLRGKLGGGDREIETLLAAHHPELVLSSEDTDTDLQDMAPASGTARQTTKRRAPVATNAGKARVEA